MKLLLPLLFTTGITKVVGPCAEPASPYWTNSGVLHVYESVLDLDGTGAEAAVKASTRDICDVVGHLATITSSEEQNAIREGFPGISWLDRFLWLGGKESSNGNWEWENGEGSIAPPAYTNWMANEPKNSAEQDCMAATFGQAPTAGQWESQPCNSHSPAGFLVEYDIILPTITCPPDRLVLVDGDTAIVDYFFTTGGSCPVLVDESPPSGSIFQRGETVVTLTAKDSYCFENPQCSFIVTVQKKCNMFTWIVSVFLWWLGLTWCDP